MESKSDITNLTICAKVHTMPVYSTNYCELCNREFKRPGALTQHLQRSRTCKNLKRQADARRLGVSIAYENITFALNATRHSEPNPPEDLEDPTDIIAHQRAQRAEAMDLASQPAVSRGLRMHHGTDYSNPEAIAAHEYQDDEEAMDIDWPDYDDLEEQSLDESGPLNEAIRSNWNKYVSRTRTFAPLSRDMTNAILLLGTLRKSKASMDTYEGVSEWHHRTTKAMSGAMTLGNCPAYISREKVFKFLRKRYNMPSHHYSQVHRIRLPYSKAGANVICNSAQLVMQSLLTDPRIQAKDYLFFNDDPFAPPPSNLNYVADLNTGLSYTETYRKLITKPGKQVLLPVLMYMDGAVTGQFGALSICAVRIALGIFNRVARDKDRFWGTLGYIPTVQDHKSRGNRLLLDSGHHDGYMAHRGVLEDEGELGHGGDEEAEDFCKAQDLHAMVAKVLEDYLKIQESGFVWDLQYNGKVYKDVEFVLFTPFMKLDSDEADKLTGKYTARNGNVGHLCRYCMCPTPETDSVLANYPYKTVHQIQQLVEDGNVEALRAMSQQYIKNAFHDVRFGQHHDRGIHGSCPMEMLHAVLLGIFKYIRDIFFEHIGPTSQAAKEVNALAKEYGELLTRKSDRDLPKTKFNRGIQAGKIMAKEYRGILLCIAAVLRSSLGYRLLTNSTGSNWSKPGFHEDWILLVETLLEWEMWLKSAKMLKRHVKACQHKHRYIMFLVKKFGRRSKGMGLKLLKFHAIVHYADDILANGVPMEFDTGSNESGHKKTKKAALLTQKNVETFDQQTSIRVEEVNLLELAQEEMEGRAMWDYALGHEFEEPNAEKPEVTSTGGARFKCYRDEDRAYKFDILNDFKGKMDTALEEDLIKFVVILQRKVTDYYPGGVELRTEHKRHGLTFRAHANYKGGVWRDWVLIQWNLEERPLPARIWGYVDLRRLPQNSGIKHGGNDSIDPGVYAIVESASYLDDNGENNISNIFTPIKKELVITDGFVRKSVLYLADVETFVAPIAVIPDIGGDKNAYFVVKNKTQWRENFLEWLDQPIRHDTIDSDIDDSDYEYEDEDEKQDDKDFYDNFEPISEKERMDQSTDSSEADEDDSDSDDSDSESSEEEDSDGE
jgi:hypothetical protein